ncbi:MAG: LysR family transcriptional regulator [Spirillospora sp.]
MDLRQIEVFLTLAEELHFGRTADRLHLTQPQVSRDVASLERHLGAPLFERTSRRVHLTALGARFRADVEPVHQQLSDAIHRTRAEAHQVTGTLRIGFLLTTGGEPLSRLIRAHETRHPGSRITLSDVSYLDNYGPLRRNEIDVLISYLVLDHEQSDLTAGPAICHTSRVLIVATTDPLAARDSVSVEDLAGRRTVALQHGFPRVLFDHFVPPATPSGKPVHRTYEFGPDAAYGVITEAVARGHIVHPSADVLTRLLEHRQDLEFIPIHDLPPVPIGPIWPTARHNAHIQAFAETAASLSGRE